MVQQKIIFVFIVREVKIDFKSNILPESLN